MDRRRFARGHSRDIRASNDDTLLPPLQLTGSEPSDLSVSFPPRNADCLGPSTCRRGTICRATAAENTTNHAESWHYGEDCLGKALMPAGENSKRTCHWLGTLRPPTSGEANSQRRTAFSAASAKYLLGPGSSNEASETLTAASKRLLPVVARRRSLANPC